MVISRRKLLRVATFSAIAASRLSTQFSWADRSYAPSTKLAETDIAWLRKAFKGEIIRPDDPAYERMRAVASFNDTTDRHPQIIARCADQQDIIRAVQFAREHSLETAVRAGGFDVLGASVCDGMVINLSSLKMVNIDRQRGTAIVQPGVRASELLAAAEPHGLAAALGCHPSIGVTGLTLGGGLGWLAGRFGASCDNVTSADVITADGKVLKASQTDDRDLFWAIKGGGGNFGIVSALEIQLHPVDQVYGGVAAYRGDFAAFLRFYRDFMKEAPDELTVELNIRQLGKPTLLATACWSGDPAEGERVLKPLREFGPPVADAMRVVSLAHLIDRPGADFGRRLFADGAPPPPPSNPQGARHYDYWRGGSLQELNDNAAAQIHAATLNAPEGWSIGLGHYMHGRTTRVGHHESSLPRKAGKLTYFFDIGWWNPAIAQTAMKWVNEAHESMQRYSGGGTYIDYLSSNNPADVQASYGENYQRLTALKRNYDPQNFFHLNRNIRPA